ncbi:MAG: hypothetical protein GY700_02770 [Propionibacteriaceae bacterium]|nr:hypothetical protein [Propionibacteriaceae bacterium]
MAVFSWQSPTRQSRYGDGALAVTTNDRRQTANGKQLPPKTPAVVAVVAVVAVAVTAN